MTTNNPLIENKGIADFPNIKAEHVEPAIDFLVDKFESGLLEIENNSEAATWDNVIVPLEEINEMYHRIWGPISHLKGVRSEDSLRNAYEKALPKVIALGLKSGQSQKLYKKLKDLKEGSDWAKFSDAQKRTIEGNLINQELSGIGLNKEKQDRFNEIQRELSKLSTDFSNNVLDATKAWEKVLTAKEEVKGLPETTLAMFSQSYKEAKKEDSTPENGPWLLTLDGPSYIAFVENAENRDIRKELYIAYFSRATEGKLDNTANIDEIIKLRQEKSELLGYKNYAEVSLAQKMANDVSEIYDLHESMREAALDHAKKEHAEIEKLAKESGFEGDLETWDLAYWSKRYEEKKYAYTESELKPYFAMSNVLDGLFSLVNKIFGITVEAANGEAPIWDKDVLFFNIKDGSGSKVASFYLDPYARPSNKRGGAWMDDCVGRKVDSSGNVQIPVAYLVCNGTPPVGETPSLMTFREVETLFHEFGHGLQHMLTKIGVASVSGINGVEWDAVELPSQFMENWCYHKATLLGLAKHYQTGETMPEELFNKIVAAKNFRSGHQILRQTGFGLVDIKLHTEYDPSKESFKDVHDRVMKEVSYMKPYKDAANFLCAFGHIFAGGYAAGYYSYMWANVLAADSFAAFEEAGLDNEASVKEVGYKFKDTVLALGGSKHPSEVFADFRGRAPKADAYMRHNGLA